MPNRLIGPRRCKHPTANWLSSGGGFNPITCGVCGSVYGWVTSQRRRRISCRRVWMRPDDPRLGADAGRVAEALIANAREEVR